MEIDGDGHLDVLSGSYSRHDQDMAGLFQVLRGKAKGQFAKPVALVGTDGEPLILPKTDDEAITDRICTRPFACDLDGDGKLDIVAGNFTGTFGWFRGIEGGFDPKATWLEGTEGPLQVEMHSDPFLIDWDGDGDLDLLSGSAQGGVFLFRNGGSKTAPRFGARETLVEPPADDHHGGDDTATRFGDAHVKAPGGSTRVWAADVDGDGKLDLLVGDMWRLDHLADGVDEATARRELAEWQKRQQKLFDDYPQEPDEKARSAWQEQLDALEKERTRWAKGQMTGFVWLLRGR